MGVYFNPNNESFTGDKKIDCPVYKPSPKASKSEKETKIKNEPEGR